MRSSPSSTTAVGSLPLLWQSYALRPGLRTLTAEGTLLGPIQPAHCRISGLADPNAVTDLWSSLDSACACRCEQIQPGDAVEAVVLSASQYFDEFQVVRDLFVPETGAWLSDYPFVKRDAFQRISVDVYNSRTAPAAGEADQSYW